MTAARCPERTAGAAGDRPDLRHDGRGGREHAVARPRGRDDLLLLRGLQVEVRGAARTCRHMTRPKVTGEAADEVRERAPDIETLARELAEVDYLVDEGLATSLFLGARLPQPLLLEGEAGVGKTEAAKALAAVLGTPLVRLQCYEGIDAAEALYEWNYPRQLLSIKLADASGASLSEEDLFGARLSHPAAAAAGARASRAATRGAADRRDRPRRRRLRGVPARVARRGQRDDPRDRHDRRRRTRRSSC